jgi:GTP-binding protein
VVINKVDRQHARPAWVLDATQDLFLELATEDAHLEFPVLYAIAREGRAGWAPDALEPNLEPLFRAILEHVPPPTGDDDRPLQILVTTLDYDTHQGRIGIGRIRRGAVSPGDSVLRLSRTGEAAEAPRKVVALYTYLGLNRTPADHARVGDIVAVTGLDQVAIGDTLADPLDPEPLLRELETNVALRVEDTDSADEFLVSGRGELHLAILVETLRREGYEFQVSRPEVILQERDGERLEPVEHLVVDTIDEHVGTVSEILGKRQGLLETMAPDGHGGVRMEFRVPTRGLIGVRGLLLTATRGHSSLASRLIGYEPLQGSIGGTRNGVLVASETGQATSYAIGNAQERAQTFVEPQASVYEGMIVGLSARPDDMAINITREKKQTNIRSSTSDIAVKLTPPVKLSLEQALDFIEPDELVEVTPRAFRLRKRLLTADERAKARKQLVTSR